MYLCGVLSMLGLFKVELRKFARDITTGSIADQFELKAKGSPLAGKIEILAELTGEARDELGYAFGRRTFESIAALYPDFVPASGNPLDFLDMLETTVFAELRRLMPEIDSPGFHFVRKSPTQMQLYYKSEEPVVEMCAGLLDSVLQHFECEGRVSQLDETPEGYDAVFEIEITVK